MKTKINKIIAVLRKVQGYYKFKSIDRNRTKILIDKIFHNKPVTKEALERNLNICKNLELDCEKRTVALLKKYKIDIDIGEYIRNANVYIHFYNYMKQYRQWYTPNNVPYKIPALLNAASPTFYKNYDEIPEKLLKEYQKYFPPKKKNNIIK